MTVLGFVFVVELASLAFALLLARWVVARDPGGPELRRVAAAIGRAIGGFFRSQFVRVAAVTVGLVVAALAIHGTLALTGRSSSIRAGFWVVLGVIAGAASLAAVARGAAELALRASVRTVAAARSSLDRALVIGLRAGGAVGIATESWSALSLLGLYALVFGMGGGFSASFADAVRLGFEAALLTLGFAWGAAAAALVVQRGGAVFHAGHDAGGDLAGEQEAGLEHDDARNPAVVGELVGDHVGVAANRAADLFVSSTMANGAALVLGTHVLATSKTPETLLPLALLPLVVRAFGVIACGFGVIVARTTDGQHPALALWRGSASSAVITLGGLAGATIWLARAEWLWFFLAGTLGLSAVLFVAHWARYHTERATSGVKDVRESLRAGVVPTIAQGLGLGLESVALPILVVASAMLGASHLGRASGVEQGPALATVTAFMAMLATGPYALAMGALGPITDGARGALAVTREVVDPDTERRTFKLDEAGFSGSAVARTYLIVVGSVAALLSATVAGWLGGAGSGLRGMTHPVIVWSGALGAALVVAYAGSATRAGARAARGVAFEVERQLRGFPRKGGIAQVPPDFTPSYRSCIDVATRLSSEGVLGPIAVALLAPPALGILLGLLYRSREPGLAAEGITCFGVVAALTGFALALAVDGARATLGAARRLSRTRGTSPGFSASVSVDALADIIGNVAGPAAQLLVRTSAVTLLVIAPFLI
jgi:K(+)-stimulated pyrophosphate-energized sodium pump